MAISSPEYESALPVDEEDDDAFVNDMREAADEEAREESNKRAREEEEEEDREREAKKLMPPPPPPPPPPADFDLGPNPFTSFGLQFVVGLGIEACVEYKSTDSPMVNNVSLEIVDEQHLLEHNTSAARIKAVWLEYTDDWPSRNRAVFNGAAAAALCPLVQAAFEVKYPSLSTTVLGDYFPRTVHNQFKSPFTGCIDDTDTKDSWKRRCDDICKLTTDLNVRAASKYTRDLAKMYENRRTMKPVFDRGSRYEHNLSFIKEAVPSKEGVFDLEKALITLYVYRVHICDWSATMKGDKTELAHEVRIIVGELKKRLTQEYKL